LLPPAKAPAPSSTSATSLEVAAIARAEPRGLVSGAIPRAEPRGLVSGAIPRAEPRGLVSGAIPRAEPRVLTSPPAPLLARRGELGHDEFSQLSNFLPCGQSLAVPLILRPSKDEPHACPAFGPYSLYEPSKALPSASRDVGRGSGGAAHARGARGVSPRNCFLFGLAEQRVSDAQLSRA
jgi:hypothetical protein